MLSKIFAAGDTPEVVNVDALLGYHRKRTDINMD
jgi:hypothetical protein